MSVVSQRSVSYTGEFSTAVCLRFFSVCLCPMVGKGADRLFRDSYCVSINNS